MVAAFPVFDLSRFEQADVAGRKALGREVDEICRATGFLRSAGIRFRRP